MEQPKIIDSDFLTPQYLSVALFLVASDEGVDEAVACFWVAEVEAIEFF